MIEFIICVVVVVAIVTSIVLPVVLLLTISLAVRYGLGKYVFLIGGVMYVFMLVSATAELERRNVTVASIVSEIYSSEEKK